MGTIYDKKRQMIKEKQEQEVLKKKYAIKEDVIIKETDNMMKFLLRSGAAAVRLLATILLAIFAAIGLTALAYPEVRQQLYLSVKEAVESIL